MALAPAIARASPPPGGSEDYKLLNPYTAQIEAAHRDDYTGWQCCSIADGAVVDARLGGSEWQIRFRNRRFSDAPTGWIDVPPNVVLRHWRNPVGAPVAWWYKGQIRCFGPTSVY